MSQGANTHGGNTPTATTATTSGQGLGLGPAPTLDDLTRIVGDLGVALGVITNQMRTLTQQVTLATSTRPRAAKVAVAREKGWNGK